MSHSGITMSSGTTDSPIIADIWDLDGYKVIPVNLDGVHGRGLAKQAFQKGLISYYKNRRFNESPLDKKIITIAVKGNDSTTAKIPGKAWSEQVTGKNLNLLAYELTQMMLWNPFKENIYVPFLGLGFGEGKEEEIFPILDCLRIHYNIMLVKPDKEVRNKYSTSFAPGVRKDKFTNGS